jgi:LCP family protein required for cell wall assembly
VNYAEIGTDRTGKQLGAAEIDADDVSLGHAGHDIAPLMDDPKPPYTLYRAKPKLFERREKERQEDRPRPPGEPPRRRRPRIPGVRLRQVVKYVGVFLFVWFGVSLIAFLVSAQIESAKTSQAADAALSGGGWTGTSANTILVLGSDARPKGTKEAGAQTIGQPSRSDSILLMRIGGGANATLSIPRDTVVDIPGHGRDKINAAYAYGGPALAIRTVEQFLGIQVNHLVEVNFDNFPQLIDALGGITYKGGCVVSRLNGGFKNGGYTLRLPAGTHEINGKQALALARTRHNDCNAKESDLSRARRQQKILNAIKGKVVSFETFIRLPLVSWTAPKAIRSDMAGPSLLGLVGAELIAGSASPHVLKPTGTTTSPGGGAGLTVDDAAKAAAVRKLLAG